jgi:hypothetical protein
LKTLISALLATVALPALAAEPQFLRIQPDQSEYVVGSRAIVFGYVDRLPTESTKELFISMRVGGEPVNAIRLSDKLVVALPKRFEAAGNHSVESNVFLQDKTEILDLEQSASFYQAQINALLLKLERENDPDAKELIEAEIAASRQKYSAISRQISDARALVEVATKQVLVSPAFRLAPSAIMDVTIDRDPAVYSVGEFANFTVHINSLFNGPDGPREPVVKATIGSYPLAPEISGETFNFTSPLFSMEDIGAREFEATYFIRPKAQADTLRNASQLALLEKSKLETQLGNSASPKERAYLESKIADLNRVITAIGDQLEEILVEVDAGSVEFTVESGEAK